LLSRILEDASPPIFPFRRLLPYAYAPAFHDVAPRWLLGAGANFGPTVPSEDLESSAGRKVIALNLDDTDDDS
ncbi:PipA/GogA/GtgA family type III secretion system effector, partial [Salmonella enterica]|uniref:PipA/GogA/GtgA family type III secretion system effector n=1 Tax=Salmonella enterica TaxID=28901 RepID=UPI000A54F133